MDDDAAVYLNTKQYAVSALNDSLKHSPSPSILLVEANPVLMRFAEMPLPPLHYAALHGQLSVLRLMLEHVGDAVVDTPFNHITPLLFAVRSRCPHCVAALLDAGADANFTAAPNEVMTPLRFAVEECSNFCIIQELIENDAAPTFESERFSSPLAFVRSRLAPCADAAEQAHWEMILDLFD